MKAIWLIEAGVYGEETNPLLSEIRRQRMQAEFVPHERACVVPGWRKPGGERMFHDEPSGSGAWWSLATE